MSKRKRPGNIDLRRTTVLIDFDNTITISDVLDDIIKRFSVSNKWVDIEEAWSTGKIGSRECLKGQLSLVSVSKARLTKFLFHVKLDPFFVRLISFLREQGVPVVIASDNFSFIIKIILKNNGITGLKVHANTLKFSKKGLTAAFTKKNRICPRCGNCKHFHLLQYRSGNNIIAYVGDGLSDVCPAEHSDLVFAKAALLAKFRKNNKTCVPFNDLGDVYRTFTNGDFNDRKTKNCTEERAAHRNRTAQIRG
ncbi:MAG: MtnX-like HAD-IB family phosphatase [Candidatus Omnitrophica bacterium]|nr:MtnX-like HAD-IB family phosphatase [Candidatus Omnitrophota bacterium]